MVPGSRGAAPGNHRQMTRAHTSSCKAMAVYQARTPLKVLGPLAVTAMLGARGLYEKS